MTPTDNPDVLIPKYTDYGADVDAGHDEPPSTDQASHSDLSSEGDTIQLVPEGIGSSKPKKRCDDWELDIGELSRRAMGL